MGMESINFNGIFSLIIFFISILFSFFLLTVKSNNRTANILLVVFLMTCSIDVCGIIIGQNLKNKPEVYEFIKSSSYIIFPSLYLYVRSICYINFKVKIKFFYHLLLFIIYNLIVLTIFISPEAELLHVTLFKLLGIFNTYLLKLQAFIYLVSISLVLNNYKKKFLENYSDGEIEIYKWLSGLVLVFFITLPLSIIKDLTYFSNHQKIFSWSIVVLTTVALFILCLFILKALYSPDFFRGVNNDINLKKRLINRKNEHKICESEFDSVNTAIHEQLRKHMIENEPFLEPKITLQELAQQMKMPVRRLSLIINQHSGQHFFDFINNYRIEKAIEIIEKSAKNEFTIQQIYFEVGFNSKSSFNCAFKKHTGYTPTEYKNLKENSPNHKKMV